jgi:uncharacterized protein (TIGR02598 family)
VDSSRRGFSLVEVVIAIGVVAFAFIAILGLLPSGLSTFKSTINKTVSSQIAQRIFNDLEVSDFGDLTSGNFTVTRYFDEQGNELTSSNAVNCIYWANITLSNAVSSTNSTTFLGNTSTNLLSVEVLVAYNPAGAITNTGLLFTPTNPNTITYSMMIGHKR